MPSKRKQPAAVEEAAAPSSEPDLVKMKVTELREELTKLGLSTSGNKAELIARLKEQSTAAPPSKKAKKDVEEEEEGEGKKEAEVGKADDVPVAGKKNEEPAAEAKSGGDSTDDAAGKDEPDPAKLKVAELKEELTKRGLDTSGNKAALVARLVSALAGSAAAAVAAGTSAAAPQPPPQQPATVPAPAGKKGAKGKKAVVEEQQAQEETDFSKAVKALGTSASKKKKQRQAKVDSLVPGGSFYSVLEDWDCMLNQTNIGQNNNKFYVIQLLHRTFGSYALWTRWGRVGEPGQNKLDHCSGLEDATKSFCKKYKDKTGNAWEDRQNFQPRAGKYTLLEMDDDDGDAEEVVAKLTALDQTDSGAVEKVVKPCSLDKPTQSLLKLIFDNDMFQEAMKSMEIDTKKMPLGKLSKGQIAKGFTALEAIEQAIKDKASRAELAKLCSTFYTIIPHAFGRSTPPVIADAETLQKKFDMLVVLGDIEVAQGMQQGQEKKEQKSAGGEVPHPLDINYQSLNARLTHIAPEESIYKTIQQYIEATGNTWKKLEILDIWEVDRQTEAARFSEHDKVDNRRLLWHGTNVAVVAAILKSGLRIMPHSGGRVGRGIYFASENSKSAAYVRCAGNTGIMFLNEVALGKEHHITMDDSSLVAPPKGFDSVVAKGRTEPDPKLDTTIQVDGKTVVVPQGKPLLMPQYGNSSFSQSEYLVYKESQCRIRYLLKLKF